MLRRAPLSASNASAFIPGTTGVRRIPIFPDSDPPRPRQGFARERGEGVLNRGNHHGGLAGMTPSLQAPARCSLRSLLSPPGVVVGKRVVAVEVVELAAYVAQS